MAAPQQPLSDRDKFAESKVNDLYNDTLDELSRAAQKLWDAAIQIEPRH